MWGIITYPPIGNIMCVTIVVCYAIVDNLCAYKFTIIVMSNLDKYDTLLSNGASYKQK